MGLKRSEIQWFLPQSLTLFRSIQIKNVTNNFWELSVKTNQWNCFKWHRPLIVLTHTSPDHFFIAPRSTLLTVSAKMSCDSHSCLTTVGLADFSSVCRISQWLHQEQTVYPWFYSFFPQLFKRMLIVCDWFVRSSQQRELENTVELWRLICFAFHTLWPTKQTAFLSSTFFPTWHLNRSQIWALFEKSSCWMWNQKGRPSLQYTHETGDCSPWVAAAAVSFIDSIFFYHPKLKLRYRHFKCASLQNNSFHIPRDSSLFQHLACTAICFKTHMPTRYCSHVHFHSLQWW